MTDDAQPAHLFVYGTLMPGHKRWPAIQELIVDQWQDHVVGQLYDLGPFPGARFDEDARIPGWGMTPAPGTMTQMMAMLDEVEGPGYRRAVVTTGVGREAWSYELIDVPDCATPIPAWTRDPADEG